MPTPRRPGLEPSQQPDEIVVLKSHERWVPGTLARNIRTRFTSAGSIAKCHCESGNASCRLCGHRSAATRQRSCWAYQRLRSAAYCVEARDAKPPVPARNRSSLKALSRSTETLRVGGASGRPYSPVMNVSLRGPLPSQLWRPSLRDACARLGRPVHRNIPRLLRAAVTSSCPNANSGGNQWIPGGNPLYTRAQVSEPTSLLPGERISGGNPNHGTASGSNPLLHLLSPERASQPNDGPKRSPQSNKPQY